MPTLKNELSASQITEDDYALIREFYGRDLGGKEYFIWKHFIDNDERFSPVKKVFHYPARQTSLGMIISTRYQFTFNQHLLTTNLLGDLGINETVKSPGLVKKLLLAGYQNQNGLVLCFSDNRKIAIYKKIFDKYTASTNFIVPFIDALLQPALLPVAYREVCSEALVKATFTNILSRTKDRCYFRYLLKNPLYHRFHFLQHNDFYCVLGITAEYAEILELSHTCDAIFQWAIQASRTFHVYCKVLLPEKRFIHLTSCVTSVISKKEVNLLTSLPLQTDFSFDPQHIWISRLERR